MVPDHPAVGRLATTGWTQRRAALIGRARRDYATNLRSPDYTMSPDELAFASDLFARPGHEHLPRAAGGPA